jgi:hypothetical protein
MTAMAATFSHLGFGDGRTSGVAWAGLAAVAGLGVAGTPATGHRHQLDVPAQPASAPTATRPRT